LEGPSHKFPVTKQDIVISKGLIGPNIGALKGETVHKKLFMLTHHLI